MPENQNCPADFRESLQRRISKKQPEVLGSKTTECPRSDSISAYLPCGSERTRQTLWDSKIVCGNAVSVCTCMPTLYSVKGTRCTYTVRYGS